MTKGLFLFLTFFSVRFASIRIICCSVGKRIIFSFSTICFDRIICCSVGKWIIFSFSTICFDQDYLLQRWQKDYFLLSVRFASIGLFVAALTNGLFFLSIRLASKGLCCCNRFIPSLLWSIAPQNCPFH